MRVIFRKDKVLQKKYLCEITLPFNDVGFFLFELILYVAVNNLSVTPGRVSLVEPLLS